MNKEEQNYTPSLPLVSIGMPVYNGEIFIRDALDSLLAQTFANFELIISDNASTDGTEAICREYASKDCRIYYIRQEINIGPSANFQFVLNLANCEYFMWAAADDVRAETYLAEVLAVFDDDKECALVFSNFHIEYIESGKINYFDIGVSNNMSSLKRLLFRMQDSCASIIYGLHRTAKIREIGVECYDYWDIHVTHWYAVNHKVKIVPKALYTARVYGALTSCGERIPYSLTGNLIDGRKFLLAEKKMIFSSFPWHYSALLYILLKYYYYKNVRNINSIIRNL